MLGEQFLKRLLEKPSITHKLPALGFLTFIVIPFIVLGLIGEAFLEQTASQLTYHGLCELNSQLKDDQLCVFFRNNHFCTMLKFKVGGPLQRIIQSFPRGMVV